MKQEINLKQILADNANMARDEDGNQVYYEWEVLNMLKQACLETLELASKEAKLLFHDGFYKENKELTYFQSGENNIQISKQSILDLKDKIK